MKTTVVGGFWLNGIYVAETTFEMELTLICKDPTPAPVRVFVEDITVKMEITSFCVPVSWMPHDISHQQN